MANRFNF